MQFNIIRTDGDEGMDNMRNYLMENYILAPKNLGKNAKKDQKAYDEYVAALKIAKEMENVKGIRFAANNPDDPIDIHLITVYFDPPGYEIEVKQLIKMLGHFDKVEFVGESTDDDEFAVLLLSKIIYE